MPAVADTSFLVAVTRTADPHHAAAKKLLAQSDPPAINHATLGEYVADCGYRARSSGGARGRLLAERAAVEAVLSGLGCAVEHVHDVDDAQHLQSSSPQLSWVDCLAVVQARGRDLWTFDKRQKAVHAKQ